jgi:uncharacterized protein
LNLPQHTLLFAGLCALLQTALTALVIMRRAQTGVDFLDGGDQRLLRRIRAHGNLAETAPMALLLLALLEINGVGNAWVLALGSSLVLGRCLHAHSLLTNNATWSRSGGMVLTLGALSIAALRGLVLVAP